MLTAIDCKKTQFHLRYKKGGRTDITDLDEGRRITAEDEITSLVFEPMKYLPASDVAGFWKRLIPDVSTPQKVTKAVEVKFWPSNCDVEDREARREPDLRVDITWGDGSKQIFLVEVKWNGKLYEGQLKKQWDQCLSDSDKRDAVHVYIGKSSNIGTERHERVKAKSWRDVQDVLNGYDGDSEPVGRWASLASGFLGKITTSPFKGFEDIVWPGEGCLRFYDPGDFFTDDRLVKIAEMEDGCMSFYQR